MFFKKGLLFSNYSTLIPTNSKLKYIIVNLKQLINFQKLIVITL